MFHMKQITTMIFIITTGCFLTLFSLTQKNTSRIQHSPSINIPAVCSLHIKRRAIVSCQPDLTTVCDQFPSQKCPIEKLKKMGKMILDKTQIKQAQSLLTAPTNSIITVVFSHRGRAKITKVSINNTILNAK